MSLLGALLAGSLLGLLVGVIAFALGWVRWWIVVVGTVALVGVVVARRRVLQLDREAPNSLTFLRGPLWGFLNGFVVGGGPYTRLAYWAWYLLPLSVIAAGTPTGGAVIWGAYSVVRIGGAVVSAALIRRRQAVRPTTPKQFQVTRRFAYVGGVALGLGFLGVAVVNLLSS